MTQSFRVSLRRARVVAGLLLLSLSGAPISAARAQAPNQPFNLFGCILPSPPEWPNAWCHNSTWTWLPVPQSNGRFFGWMITYPDPVPPAFADWSFQRFLDIHVRTTDGRWIDSFDESLLPGPIDFEVAEIRGWYALSNRRTGQTAQTQFDYGEMTLSTVPEPGTLELIAIGGALLVGIARRRRQDTNPNR